MIKIISKEQCCGCSACLHICPKQSISFKEDKEGFLYPKVNMDTCIDCGLCEKVCPVINQNDKRFPLQVYAAKHSNDEIRMNSSSGGIFTFLAEQIIDEGGVVFGAKFNEKWEVVHDFAETKEGLIPFRGSKYVQSRIGNAYVSAEKFLKSGRKVMFTGTPCQIAGLRSFLRKEYDNLLTVDFVCHGVPSPLVWKKYITEEIECHKNTSLKVVNFRDKSTGWKKYSLAFHFKETVEGVDKSRVITSMFQDNLYMQAFLSDLSLRPSCYNCFSKMGRSGSCITLGDFWGVENVHPYLDDDHGVSIILKYTPKVMNYHNSTLVEIKYEDAVAKNRSICESVSVPLNRGYFFARVSCTNFTNSWIESTSAKLFHRIRRFIYRSFTLSGNIKYEE